MRNFSTKSFCNKNKYLFLNTTNLLRRHEYTLVSFRLDLRSGFETLAVNNHRRLYADVKKKMKAQYMTRQTLGALATIFILAVMVTSAEIAEDLPANHKGSVVVPGTASLAVEARGDQDGVDLDSVEGKSSSSLIYADGKADEPGKPIILGSTSKVAVVYSERKPAVTEKSVKPSSRVEDRSWRVVKAAPRDSYLDALNHSHSSKDPREGVVGVDAKPKASRPIRREYSEGPVYRPVGGQYGAPKDPGFSYGSPTEEPFLPTPSDAYSLPVQSSGNFNNDRGSYAAPHNSYGAPSAPDASYGVPSLSWRPTSHPQNSYGPSANGYLPSGSPQQAYGPPSSYGSPYAIQDYSQHLPSLPSIDFSWPFALKLNAFTLAKILLKLVIFKMIVKFIAVICLLLFIPKLEIVKKDDKDDNGDDGDDSRRLGASDSTLERLNVLTALVTSSIEKYDNETGKSASSGEECTSLVCRMRKLITGEDAWKDYARLLKSYVTEETDKYGDHWTRTNHVET